MADPRNELADIIVPAAPDIVASGNSLLLWVAVGGVWACIAGAAWLWQRRRPARALRRIASAAVLQQNTVPALAARLDAWARARYRLTRLDAAQCPSGMDRAVWADWVKSLTQLRFALPSPEGYAALGALCETARAWKNHV